MHENNLHTPLEGQVALVSGASRGIGAAIALALGVRGARVFGTATSDAGATGVAERLAENGIAGGGLRLDVTDPDSIAAVFARIKEEAGAVSVLVNNAGITGDNLLLRMKPEEWEAIIQTNLGSVYRMCKAALRPMMKARYGRIVNIASVVALMGNPGQCNYAAAKAGIIGFGKSLAREVGSRGITVNTVAPGFIETDMTRAMDEAQRGALTEQIPLQRLGQARDIAEAVAFLASPGAGYLTGETLNVNGGMYMH